jgi:2-polyprenyl-3-methyl-5-hydroxy-6-metoxy-1,4-benzoquinol methylase
MPLEDAIEMPTRNEILLGPIDRSMQVLEVGPSFNPVAPKADGWNVRSIDHLSREALIEKYRGHAGVDASRIEDVDFVWTGGDLSSAVPEALHGSFDALIASHVIEHTPDLLAFLESVARLLKPQGVVALAIPDKRYCFDYFKPVTMTGDVLAATGRIRHARDTAFNGIAYAATVHGRIAWSQEPVGDLKLLHSLDQAYALFQSLSDAAGAPYHDMHAWCFTPASFERLMLELAWIGVMDWRVERMTTPAGCEFLAWLRRGGKEAARARSAEALAECRLDYSKRALLETREQIDFLQKGEEAQKPAAPQASPPVAAPASDVNRHYVDWLPRAENAFRIFEGEWTSSLPGFNTGGKAKLFEDGRIAWYEEKLGSFAGKRVLELGPLEGAHTTMMTHRGAEVLAIEANQRAFLRCLAVKEVLDLQGAKFLLGDFVRYLSENPPNFDFVLASGVLYHMRDPVGLLRAIAAVTDAIGLWTHYFDPEALAEKGRVPQNFTLQPRRVQVGSRQIELYDQKYLESLKWSGFCGGTAPGSAWMTRDGILGVLEDAGFVTEAGVEQRDHPNGPAFCVFARRVSGKMKTAPAERSGASAKFALHSGPMAMASKLTALEREIEALRRSTSWRITAPLRALKLRIGRYLG